MLERYVKLASDLKLNSRYVIVKRKDWEKTYKLMQELEEKNKGE